MTGRLIAEVHSAARRLDESLLVVEKMSSRLGRYRTASNPAG
jgi:hypothetical protein